MPQDSEVQKDPTSQQISELTKEFQYLTEDQKIIKIMDMMKHVFFGTLTIKKHKGKISSFTYQGEVLFRLEEFDKNKKGKPS